MTRPLMLRRNIFLGKDYSGISCKIKIVLDNKICINHEFINRGKEAEKPKSEAPTTPDVQNFSVQLPKTPVQLKVKGQISCCWFIYLSSKTRRYTHCTWISLVHTNTILASTQMDNVVVYSKLASRSFMF